MECDGWAPKIKDDVLNTGKLNPAYIPILQNISPGEIQHFENAQNFSRTLVTKWLKTYKMFVQHQGKKLPTHIKNKGQLK